MFSKGKYLCTHWDKVRPSKVSYDSSGSADSHVTDERKQPSELKKKKKKTENINLYLFTSI